MTARDDFPMLATLARHPSAGPIHREADRILDALDEARTLAGLTEPATVEPAHIYDQELER